MRNNPLIEQYHQLETDEQRERFKEQQQIQLMDNRNRLVDIRDDYLHKAVTVILATALAFIILNNQERIYQYLFWFWVVLASAFTGYCGCMIHRLNVTIRRLTQKAM